MSPTYRTGCCFRHGSKCFGEAKAQLKLAITIHNDVNITIKLKKFAAQSSFTDKPRNGRNTDTHIQTGLTRGNEVCVRPR